MMVSNNVMLIGQCLIGPSCVHTDRPIVIKDICWFIDQNPKHMQFVAQCIYYLHWIIHHSELWSKCWRIKWVMPLAEPYYWRTVAKQHYSGLRYSRLSVTSMIRVNKTMRQHEVASFNWNIPWDRLLRVPIKLLPVTLLEPVFVDGRMCRVETQLPIWMRLKVSKDMELLI